MDIFYDSEVPPRLFLAINRCRLFHKVLTLSDLITGQGNKIRNYLWTEHPIPHDDRRNWPMQGIPTTHDWKIWRECLKAMFAIRSRDATIHPNYQLGTGSVPPNWKWYFFQDTIYEDRGALFVTYTEITRRRSRTKRFSEIETVPTKPQLALPCIVEKDGTKLIMTGSFNQMHRRCLSQHPIHFSPS